MGRYTGTTTAHYGSPRRTQSLAGATLHFYPDDNADAARSAWGWRSLDGLPSGGVGRATVRPDGSFEAELDTDARRLTVAAEIKGIDGAPDAGRAAVGLLGSGVVEGKGGGVLDIALDARSFCALLRDLGLWLVAGRVSDCAKTPLPATGATVTVFDRDITQDDTIGTDVTDAAGEFAVYFTADAFRQIPALAPPFDIIPPHELFGGPDVFFKVEAGGGTLLDEPPARGRDDDRENRPNCTYVELCVEAPEPGADSLTLWERIGNVDVPTFSDLGGFDADGFVDSGKLAFHGRIDFNGAVAQTFGGHPVRYRFLFAEWSSLSTPPSAPGDFAPLTSAHITSARYGALVTKVGPGPADVVFTDVPPNPDAQGWVAVSQSPDFLRNEKRLVQVDTSTLVPGIGKGSPPTAGAGAPVPPVHQDRPRKFSFVMEVEAGPFSYASPRPVVVHLNNSAAYARFELDELLSDVCAPVPSSGGSITVHPQLTVGHPYLDWYSVTVQRQGGALETPASDDHAAHGSVWTAAAGETDAVTATYTDVPSPPRPCSYRARLNWRVRLTNGVSQVDSQTILRTFCGS